MNYHVSERRRAMAEANGADVVLYRHAEHNPNRQERVMNDITYKLPSYDPDVTRPYTAGYKDMTTEAWATSLYAAKVQAEKFFNPPKRDRGLVWVCLADVEHTADF